MATKIQTLGIERDIAYLYYVQNGDVWRILRSSEDERCAQLVHKTDVTQSGDSVLYLDVEGDLCSVPK